MTIFSDQGSIAVGSVLTEACSVAVATTAIRFKGGANWPRVDRQKVRILCRPFSGKSVEWTFSVVFLVRDHAPDADDQIIEPLRRRPEISDTDHRVVKVGVKDWR